MKYIAFGLLALLLVGMANATHGSSYTQEAAVSAGATTTASSAGAPTSADIPPIEAELTEGETKVYYWHGVEYEFTLLYVSDPVYWEGAAAEKAYSDSPEAKFLLNGEATERLQVGEKAELFYGTLKVEKIASQVTGEGERGIAAFTFYPEDISPPSDKLHIAEGQTKSITVDGREFEITAEMVSSRLVGLIVNEEEESVRLHEEAIIGGLNLYVFDLWDATEVAVLGRFSVASTNELPFEGWLSEGESKTYSYEGEEYEVSVNRVSRLCVDANEAISQSDTDTATSESFPGYCSDTATLSLNGESQMIREGASARFDCGTLQAASIDTGEEAVNYKLWPRACTSNPPPNDDTQVSDRLRENECKTYTLVDYELEVCFEDVEILSGSAVCIETENDDCASPATLYHALFTINDEELRVREGRTETFTQSNFHGKMHVEDILVNSRERIVKFTMAGYRSAPGSQGCAEDAKICPDGTVLVRQPELDCQFPACPSDPIACAADAKRCPDGSYVGRVGPDCQFATCPAVGPDDCDGEWICPTYQYGTEPDCYCLGTNMPYPDDIPAEECAGQLVCDDSGECECYRTNMPYPDEPGHPACDTGCAKDGRCLPYGTRLANGEAVYCSIEGTFETQMGDGSSCQNNYECSSNQCLNGECKSLDRQLEENTGLLQRIIGWLGGIFG